jgi:hypothetical protein
MAKPSPVKRIVWRIASALPGSTPGTILEKFSGDPGISVMVPAAHRLKIWVQIWAQFSLLGAPSALFTLLGITEDSSEVLCFPLAVSFTRWKS